MVILLRNYLLPYPLMQLARPPPPIHLSLVPCLPGGIFQPPSPALPLVLLQCLHLALVAVTQLSMMFIMVGIAPVKTVAQAMGWAAKVAE